MSFTDISIQFLEYFSDKSSIEDKKIVDDLLHKSIDQIKQAQPKWVQPQINFDELVEAIIKIKKILNISTEALNSSNKMEQVTFVQLLMEMNSQNFHQNMNSTNLPVAYRSAKIKVEPIASCKFHQESLLEHSIMCMIISMIQAGQNSKKYVLSGFTALFHDIGKINTTTVFGTNDLGYPFHGAYGSTLLSQYGSDELFEMLGSKQNFLDMMHTIKDHMCSYHITDFKTEWNIQRCEAACLSYSTSPQMKELSHNLSFGDSFGKISDISDCADFLTSRADYDEITSESFNCENFMKKIGVKVPIFFIRGSSGSGKTTFIKNKLIPYLCEFFDESRIEVISRDEIMCSLSAQLSNIILETPRPIGDTYSNLYKTYQSKKLGKPVNDELKERISTAILQNKIAIIDSCILYYDGISQIMPDNITNAYKVAIDCNRSIPYTTNDAKKNGQSSIDELNHLYKFRTPTTWINNLKFTILDSMYTRSSPSNTSLMPHIVFSYGFNTEHECGFETLQQVLKPVMEYFV
jgi:hypothetical protein